MSSDDTKTRFEESGAHLTDKSKPKLAETAVSPRPTTTTDVAWINEYPNWKVRRMNARTAHRIADQLEVLANDALIERETPEDLERLNQTFINLWAQLHRLTLSLTQAENHARLVRGK